MYPDYHRNCSKRLRKDPLAPWTGPEQENPIHTPVMYNETPEATDCKMGNKFLNVRTQGSTSKISSQMRSKNRRNGHLKQQKRSLSSSKMNWPPNSQGKSILLQQARSNPKPSRFQSENSLYSGNEDQESSFTPILPNSRYEEAITNSPPEVFFLKTALN